MKQVLTFEEADGTNFCCGLVEIGGFRVENADNVDDFYIKSEETWKPDPDRGYFATTLRTQTGTIKRLKRLGFKKLGSWTRDTGVKLTLWGYFPRRRKRKKK